MSARLLAPAGLDLVAARMIDLRMGQLIVEPARTVLGRADLAGCSRPLPSSAAVLRLGDKTIWVPAPMQMEPTEPEQGRAPLYLHGGQELALPWIRLFVPKGDEAPEQTHVEYLSLSDWLHDAVTVWRYEPTRRDGPPRTLLDHLAQEKPAPEESLSAIARVLWFALFGSAMPAGVCGLRLPVCPMWLRPAGETSFARRLARSLVVTARLPSDPARPAVPSTNLRAAAYRIRPAQPRDWGLDPVHTPEGADIRLTGRLGLGVAVRARKLHYPGSEPPLSASSARLPFAGYNDPRRLLMAANMQTHAMPLPQQEPPAVRKGAAGEDPPGVNLRVAYLAWQGWNHEDAWVLSESAARRLGTVQILVQTLAIRALELTPELLVQRGDAIERGRLLVRRFVAPALLCPSLELLASLEDLDDKVTLRPEIEDTAPQGGTVLTIEKWDLCEQTGMPAEWLVPDTVAGTFRMVYRIHIERTLPLAVGDKLANRHGHKGVVGAILPDEEMPRWRGQPLDALIDPISVLNRSNWGQVYESLAGAMTKSGQSRDVSNVSGDRVREEVQGAGADAQGRWLLEPPTAGKWLTKEVRAVAGIQYVMRMPHHACDKISGSPLPPPASGYRLRRRSQRLGEMEHWALWAHDLGGAASTANEETRQKLSPAVARLRRLLAAAGFSMEVEGESLRVRRLALDTEKPTGFEIFSLLKGANKSAVEKEASEDRETRSLLPLAELYDALDAVAPETPTVLVFDPPLTRPSKGDEGEGREGETVRWLPILPACDRRPRRLFDGSEEPHELTVDLRRVVRLLRSGSMSAVASASQDELFYAVRRLLDDAYAAAVGRSATGPFSSKLAYLRRGVLGRRLPRSARATVSPGGTLGLALDEIGLPPALAYTLFGAALSQTDNERRVWLKRDPVLHRWGLLPVRVRVIAGNTIRLPASLLGPLGADFDGDTVALFAALPSAAANCSVCSPSALAWHPSLEEAMFKPGKQYQYGLYLLAQHAENRAQFQTALQTEDAPAWPEVADVRSALSTWIQETSKRKANGHWWTILEQHALRALANNPAMGLGLGSAEELARLPVIRCGAAKDLYSGTATRDVLRGESLTIYRRRDDSLAPLDPIADVMVAAKASIGQFGGALRRLIYSAEQLRPEDIQNAQCLTEQVTQKALSVKAGEPPLRYADFERQLRRLLKGQELKESDREELQALLARVGKKLESLWEALGSRMPRDAIAWLTWLRQPHELKGLIDKGGELRLPLKDLRLRLWTAADSWQPL